MGTQAVLLDIEGTTTSISFVTDVLFPDCARALPDFLARHHQEERVAAACAAVLADATPEELSLGGHGSVLATVRRQMAQDAKATGLKQLQGLVWEEGYRSGRIRAHVFPDLPPALARWKQEHREVAIYSSGSILAQKLLFSHSEAGDLTPFLCAYYDTTSGSKREPASYGHIAQAWGRASSSIIFCTDPVAEAAAARSAGMEAVLLMRPGNAPLPPQQECQVHGDLSRI